MQSHSIQVKPIDSRCRFWAKVLRAGSSLPFPMDVTGANDLPGAYLPRGDEELAPGDALLEGEAVHHKRTDRGWTYSLWFVTADGRLLRFRSGFSSQKTELKAQGLPTELLKGSGDIAAMVRIIHGLRAGLTATPTD